MMKVKFVSRYEAKRLSKQDLEDVVFISINDTNDELKEMNTFLENYETLFLKFFDIDDSDGGFTNEQANIVKSFVHNAFIEGKDIIVHCFAGVSRSGAIAKWINEHYSLNDVYLENYKMYNKHVYSLLSGNNINQETSMF